MELPFIDEHTVTVDAPPEATWAALCAVVTASFATARTARVARALGCEPAGSDRHAWTLAPGAALPGFAVERFDPPRTLQLSGRHRFARYELAFLVDPLGGGGCRVRARTSASFPGLRGRVYRALVIGTRGHVLVVRRMLAATRRRAARTATPGP
jgi:Protein of unknown function (DUF2867)